MYPELRLGPMNSLPVSKTGENGTVAVGVPLLFARILSQSSVLSDEIIVVEMGFRNSDSFGNNWRGSVKEINPLLSPSRATRAIKWRKK